jgi:hypothetical protein
MNYAKLGQPARYLLKISAFFDSPDVPWKAFRLAFQLAIQERSATVLEPRLHTFLVNLSKDGKNWDPLLLEDIVGDLRAYSLVNLRSGDSHYLHPLVRDWCHDRMPYDERECMHKAAHQLMRLIRIAPSKVSVSLSTVVSALAAVSAVPLARIFAVNISESVEGPALIEGHGYF